MELIVNIVSFVLIIVLVLSPMTTLRLVNKSNLKFKATAYFAIGLITMAIIVLIFAWWAYSSKIILLKHYGFNIDGMSDAENYEKVLPKNFAKAKSLEASIMGIGWPLKGMMNFLYYSPYLIIVYFLNYLVGRIRSRKNVAQ